jgi:ribosomal protein S18 acetylase RimI-like enzyme
MQTATPEDVVAMGRIAEAAMLVWGEILDRAPLWRSAEKDAVVQVGAPAQPAPVADGAWKILPLDVAPETQGPGLGQTVFHGIVDARLRAYATILGVSLAGAPKPVSNKKGRNP